MQAVYNRLTQLKPITYYIWKGTYNHISFGKILLIWSSTNPQHHHEAMYRCYSPTRNTEFTLKGGGLQCPSVITAEVI
jgi:hypothetical protein